MKLTFFDCLMIFLMGLLIVVVTIELYIVTISLKGV